MLFEVVLSGLTQTETTSLRSRAYATLKLLDDNLTKLDIVSARPIGKRRPAKETAKDTATVFSVPLAVSLLFRALMRSLIVAHLLINAIKLLPADVQHLKIAAWKAAKTRGFSSFVTEGRVYNRLKNETRAVPISTEEDLFSGTLKTLENDRLDRSASTTTSSSISKASPSPRRTVERSRQLCGVRSRRRGCDEDGDDYNDDGADFADTDDGDDVGAVAADFRVYGLTPCPFRAGLTRRENGLKIGSRRKDVHAPADPAPSQEPAARMPDIFEAQSLCNGPQIFKKQEFFLEQHLINKYLLSSQAGSSLRAQHTRLDVICGQVVSKRAFRSHDDPDQPWTSKRGHD
ncbi:hypothetical protein TSAR_006411 [Trichomalopsis sarcophagae]|uniref:Uncharacterized protein n=1 Tax=Trichomalopsis sarcophagae TaxID=543379 RepID=A0A232EGB9_9HYME|nr:hypothetical protein TSAR_006411 [Trichomalopsis sarcophagae]